MFSVGKKSHNFFQNYSESVLVYRNIIVTYQIYNNVSNSFRPHPGHRDKNRLPPILIPPIAWHEFFPESWISFAFNCLLFCCLDMGISRESWNPISYRYLQLPRKGKSSLRSQFMYKVFIHRSVSATEIEVFIHPILVVC